MLFQGQEFASSAPFLYFADHEAELGRDGAARAARSSSRSSRASPTPEMQAHACRTRPTPQTFERCKLDCARARRRTQAVYALHRDLLRCGARTRCFSAQRAARRRRRRARRRRRSCCASSARRRRRPAAGREPRPRPRSSTPRPSRCSRRPRARVWAMLWSSEDVRLRRRGHAAARDDGRLAHPGARRDCLAPMPRSTVRSGAGGAA